MPASNTPADTKTEREPSVPPPHVPPQPVVTRIDMLPDRHIGSREAMKRIDDLAPAKGIMLCVLLGITLWGGIAALCLR